MRPKARYAPRRKELLFSGVKLLTLQSRARHEEDEDVEAEGARSDHGRPELPFCVQLLTAAAPS